MESKITLRAEEENEPHPNVSLDTENKGAFVKTLHTSREVKIYGLLETEIENLTCIGREQRLWSTIGAAAFALLLGCLWDMSNAPQGSKIPTSDYILIAVFILATLFSILKGFQYWIRQRNAIADLLPDKRVPLSIQIKDRILGYLLSKLPRI